ncbi:MAG: type II toxin-antitoxin system RelE/ParE family toxin [Thermodesulfobacteriota bacterium]
MRFIETSIFTREVCNFFEDEEYRALQFALLLRPEQGIIIPGTNGLRKLRWGLKGKGKQGGCRVIYYWDKKDEAFYMLFVYSKSKQDDLTPVQIRVLSKLVQEEFK